MFLVGHEYQPQRINRFGSRYYDQAGVDEIRNKVNNTNFHVGIYQPVGDQLPDVYDSAIIDRLPKAGEFVIDLDFHSADDSNPDLSPVSAAATILRRYGACPVIYFSGRGFHLHVASTLVDPALPMIHRRFAREVIPEADYFIHNQAGLIRDRGSLNKWTGTYKVVVTDDDIRKGMLQIKSKAREPGDLVLGQPSDRFDSELLTAYHQFADASAKVSSGQPHESWTNARIVRKHREILETAEIQKGTRHFTTLKLTANLRHAGYTEEQAHGILMPWASRVYSNGFSSSDWYRIAADTADIIEDTYRNSRWIDWETEVERLYRANVSRFKGQKRWRGLMGPMKVYSLIKTMARLTWDSEGRIYLAQSVIKKHVGSNSTGGVAYIDVLIEKGYIAKLDGQDLPSFVESDSKFKAPTNCFKLLR